MLKYVILVLCASLLCVTAACSADTTRKYGISFASADISAPKLQEVEPQIDEAMDAAVSLRGVSANVLKGRYISVYFTAHPFTVDGEPLAGGDTDTQVETVYFPCLFDTQSAIVHEFLHLLNYASDQPYDVNHTGAYWPRESILRAELRARLCPAQTVTN